LTTRVEVGLGERPGDEGTTESKLGDGGIEELGGGAVPFGLTSSSIGSALDGEIDISGGPPGISKPREPVDDSRTSIRDKGFGLDAKELGVVGPDVDSATFARGVMPSFTWAEDGFVVGASGFNFPIDIFFRNPHLPGCSFGLSSFLRNTLRWRTAVFSASYKESRRRGTRGCEASEIFDGGVSDDAEAAACSERSSQRP
jgi:hypothetical protein